MGIDIFAINLDRSNDRWTRLAQQAAELDFRVVRVPGVDGAQVDRQDWIDCDERSFRRNNGRTILPGEYGCYRSHLKALSTFLEDGQHLGIVVEDDIELSSDLVIRTQAAFEALPEADVIKLCNHRIVWFKVFATSSFGDEVGRAGHGPQGSAACYAVTRAGACKLTRDLQRMTYPWDVALERGWAMKAKIYATRVNVAAPGRYGTTIASRSVYRGTKFKWWKRLRAYAVRTVESARRLCYSLWS
jgi:glycosyl transferase family 25